MNIQKIINEEEIQKRIDELTDSINKYYKNEELYVICILKGSVIFTCDLIKKLKMPVVLDFLIASSYGEGTSSSGIVKILKDIDVDINNKNILIIDDIIDTGYTMKKIVEHLTIKNPKSIKTCVLLSKIERRVVNNIKVDYVGFNIENEFVLGYGLDYNQKFRNIPYIGKIQ